jgi:membrane-associated phospholipid phosphatase
MKASRLLFGCAVLGAVALPCGLAEAAPEGAPPPTDATAAPAPDATPPPVATTTPPAPPPPPPTPTPIPPPSNGGLEKGQHFTLDPVSDGALTAFGFGFSLLLGFTLGTGEIKPPQISVSSSSLLPIDRTAVNQKIDPNAPLLSDIGLYGTLGFAALDTLLSGFRDGWDASLVDGFMYAESASLALTLTDLTKIAVRRPRPIDYINCPLVNGAPNPSADCQSTDLGLSFFSGHAAMVSAIGATATYIAFVRAGAKSPRPWITLVMALAVSTFVSVERVTAGEHFPTDVIAGSVAGAAIGVLVPHLHRHMKEAPPVWIGAAPAPGGGSVALQGRF